MSYVIVNSRAEVAELPDGTLISWLPVIDDPSSEAVAFVRKVTGLPLNTPEARSLNVWVSPGNGWAPEPLTTIVFPARIILLGTPRPGDYVPPAYLTSTDGEVVDSDTADFLLTGAELTGGTYPRDVALQAAVTLLAPATVPGISPADATSLTDITRVVADKFADWLTADPMTDRITELVNQGVVSHVDSNRAGYFAGGPTDA